MKPKGAWHLFVILILVSSAAADVRPSSLRTFSFRIPDEPETLDWNRAHTPIEAYILMNLMEGLVRFGTGPTALKVVPALAQRWQVSTDGMLYTFQLRPGVRWSDGQPLKAQDFVFSWKRLLSPATAAAYAYLLFDIQGAEAYNQGLLQDFSQVGIKALSDRVFQVKLNHPQPQWIQTLAFWVTYPLREDIVKKYGEMWATPGRMVTLGPFVLMSHDLNSKIVMRSGAFYFGKRGNVDEVVAQIIPSDTEALHLYQAGELDLLTDLAGLDMTQLYKRPDRKLFPYLKTAFIEFVTSKYPASNLKVRRAIAMSINKQKLVELLGGGQQAATTFVPPPLLGYATRGGLDYNPSLAMLELRHCGIDWSEESLTLDYLIPNSEKSKIVGKFIQSELKKNLGIEVNLKASDHQDYRLKIDLNTFPLFESSWTADFPDPDNFLSIFLSTSGNRRTTWKDETFDQEVQLARQSNSPKEREVLYRHLQQTLLQDDAVVVPLYYESNLVLVRPRVRNLEINPMNGLDLRRVDVGG